MTLDTIKQRLRATLLVSASGKNALDTAARLASEMGEDGSWPNVCTPEDAVPEWRYCEHLARTMLLAKACHLAPGELRGATTNAFDWWLSRDPRPASWHQDQVTVPRLVGEIALLSEDDLSVGAWGKVTEILTRSRWAYWAAGTGWAEWTGSTVVEVAYNLILRGCLENSPALCEGAFQRAFRKVQWSGEAEGAVSSEESAASLPPYVYGKPLIRNYARLMTLTHGTHWQAPVESTKAFVSYLLDFQQWTLWRDVPMEDTGFPQDPEDKGLGTAIAQLAQLGNPPRRVELSDMADRLAGRGKALVGHRHFWRSRFAVHQRPNFYCSLALGPTDARNHGVSGDPQPPATQSLYLMRTGREYAGLDEERSLLPATETQSGHQQPKIHSFSDSSRIDGGISEGEYGMAVSLSNGGNRRGKNAWFFFDQSVVCLGTSLFAAQGRDPLRTRINRCRRDGPVVVEGVKALPRQQLAPKQRHDLPGVRRVEHGEILYYFPDGARIVVEVETTAALKRPAARPEEVFTLEFIHEAPPLGGSSAWFILPLDDDPAARQRAAAEISQIDILANHSAVQAVRHQESGVVSVAFWEPAVLALPRGGRIAANSPCMILCREESDGAVNVTIANLLPRTSVVHVEYQGRCVCFELPGGAEAGRSYRRRL